MADLAEPNPAAAAIGCAALSVADFPEDVLLCILSFLAPSEIGSFSSTSKRFVSLCRSESRLWYVLCDRRWGDLTQIRSWGGGKISFKLLFKTLARWEGLIGFWRRSGQRPAASSPPLVFFEWGPSFIVGSRVSSSQNGTYGVVKVPFLWMGLTREGQVVNFIDPKGKSFDFSGYLTSLGGIGFQGSDLVPVLVNFIGKTHLVVEENLGFLYNSGLNGLGETSSSSSSSSSSLSSRSSPGRVVGDDRGECSPPGCLQDLFMSEIYQHFANRTSPGTDRRKQRRREKERQVRRKWETEHFVKIVNCSPTALRPLQGLWKGICDDMSMYFYLVVYDETGGISCRKIGDTSEKLGEERFAAYAPVFWTSSAKFIELPSSQEEEYIYDARIHLQPHHTDEQLTVTENEAAVSHLLYINSSYDLVIPGTSANPRQAEGRIWQYENGTFGFGFLRDNFIIDLKHIAKNGCLLDTT